MIVCFHSAKFREGIEEVMSSTRNCSSREEVFGDSSVLKESYWVQYFENRHDWWGNRENKRNPIASNFKHKVTRKALWVNGWFIPDWIKDRFLGVEKRSNTVTFFVGDKARER